MDIPHTQLCFSTEYERACRQLDSIHVLCFLLAQGRVRPKTTAIIALPFSPSIYVSFCHLVIFPPAHFKIYKFKGIVHTHKNLILLSFTKNYFADCPAHLIHIMNSNHKEPGNFPKLLKIMVKVSI